MSDQSRDATSVQTDNAINDSSAMKSEMRSEAGGMIANKETFSDDAGSPQSGMAQQGGSLSQSGNYAGEAARRATQVSAVDQAYWKVGGTLFGWVNARIAKHPNLRIPHNGKEHKVLELTNEGFLKLEVPQGAGQFDLVPFDDKRMDAVIPQIAGL